MTAAGHADFANVVLNGTRAARGMGGFGALLSAEEAEAIRIYIAHSAWLEYRQ